MKRGFVEALYCDVKEALKELESVQVYRTSDGIALSIDNERVGMIPIVLDGMIKNLDYNAADEEDAYVEAQRAAAIKAEEAAALKARKIEESARARAAKLAQKELERGKGGGLLGRCGSFPSLDGRCDASSFTLTCSLPFPPVCLRAAGPRHADGFRNEGFAVPGRLRGS